MGVPHLLDARPGGKLAFVVVAWCLGCFAALAQPTAPGQSHELWPPMGIAFLWLTLVWDGRRATVSRTAPHLAVMVVSFASLAVLLDYPLAVSLRMGVLNAVGAVVMLGLYLAARRGRAGWCPGTAPELVGVVGSAIAGTMVCGLFGGLPTLAPFDVQTSLALWWTIRGTVFGSIAAMTFLVFLHGDIARWRSQSTRAPITLVLLPGATVLTLLLAFDHGRPLSWAVLLVAIWAGLVFTPIGAAVHAISVSLLAAAATFVPQINQYQSTGGVLPDSYLMDILLTASAFTTTLLALLRDERAQAEAGLAAQRARAESQAALLAQVFDSMNDGLLLVRGNGEVRANPAARTLLERAIPDRVEDGWEELVDQVEPVGSTDSQAGAALLAQAGERLLEVRTSTLPDDVTVVLFADVTARQRRIEELTGFAGVVAHDLRSPLTGLVGWLEMIEVAAQDADVEEIRGLLPRARVSARRLGQVIEDWVTYALQREGRLHLAEVSLQTLGEEVVATWQGPGSTGTFLVDTPHRVMADASLVRQLLANLIGNAVKFARPDESVHVTVTSTADDPGWVRTEVADRGIGVPPGQEQAIFEEFHRVESHDHIEGTGLGLSLCHRIVTRHGGTITALRNPTGGTTIVFTLPVAASTAVPATTWPEGHPLPTS